MMGKTLYEKYITFCMQSFPISLINIYYLLLLKLYQKGWNGNPTFVLCNFKADSYEKSFKTNFRNNDVFICCLCEW